jgi:ribonuclease HI
MASGHKRELSGGEPNTTNNRMELMAVIRSLQLLTRPCEVDLYSDSAYVVNAFNENWIEGWQRKGWVNSAKHPVANKDLWLELIEQCNIHKVNFIKVKGHADNEFNNRCDELAVAESQKFSKG